MTEIDNKGWIKLHRKIEDNELWFSEPFTKAQAWIDLVLNANHKDGIMNIRGNMISIKRGQIGWSEITMTKRWRWSRDKVRNFLKWLKSRQQIIHQKDRFITTIITICNYEEYQDEKTIQQTRQQKNSRPDINKNVNNEKNNISEKSFADNHSEIFNQREYVAKMLTGKKPMVLIAGLIEQTGAEFPSKKAIQDYIKRHIRSATILAEYPDDKVEEAFNKVISQKFIQKWDLGTVLKYIN